LQEGSAEMNDATGEIEQVLTLLAATPRRIASTTGGLDRAHLHSQPDPDSWSANEIVAHLRANADVWGKSILRMIAEDHPTIRYVSPRGWMTKSGYTGQEFSASFQAFTDQRDELLHTLRNLAIEGWSRGATFTGTTRGREQTVLSYAQRIVEHEAQHLPQLEDTINAVRT
jgi:hypothetical protein